MTEGLFGNGTAGTPPTSRRRLDETYRHAPAHLRPVIKAVRDHNVDMLFVPQGSSAFRMAPRHPRPVIYIIGDDFDCAHGPEGFHMPSVRRAIRQSLSFAVISSAPQADAYAAMAISAAAARCSTVIVETRPEQEIQWIKLIQKLAPKRFVWLATIEGGHA